MDLATLPPPALRAIVALGRDLSRARRRRQLTQASLAERVGVSVPTVRRMEAGDPRIPLQVLARVLLVFGELARLERLLDSGEDPIGLALADERLPRRVRAPKRGALPGAL